jgi:hypothetical protein
MKALTIYQPYAALISVGAKRFETRSWNTPYRGPIAIHSAKKPYGEVLNEYAVHCDTCGLMHQALERALGQGFDFSYGAVIATANLAGCYLIDRIEEFRGAGWKTGCWDGDRWIDPPADDLLFGDWTPGRYAWDLQNVETIIVPQRARGAQGLWEWDEVARSNGA